MRATWPDRVFHSHLHIAEDVEVDQVRMAQFWSNLLGNATTHRAEDIPIRSKRQRDGRFGLTVANEGASYVQVEGELPKEWPV